MVWDVDAPKPNLAMTALEAIANSAAELNEPGKHVIASCKHAEKWNAQR